MNSYFPYENQVFMGIPFTIPSRYACWAELVLIQVLFPYFLRSLTFQLITPNASFVGHMAGILVGLLYAAGPLKWLTDFLVDAIGIGGG